MALPRRYFLKTSLVNQQKLLRNEGISISGNVPVVLFKKQDDGLGKLSVSPRSNSGNGGRVIRGYRGGKNRKPSDLLKMSPDNHLEGTSP